MSHHSHPKSIITNQQAFTNSKISTQRNNIYLYGDITPETCEQLKNQLTEMEFNAKLFKISYNSDPPPINLHVQSWQAGYQGIRQAAVSFFRFCCRFARTHMQKTMNMYIYIHTYT